MHAQGPQHMCISRWLPSGAGPKVWPSPEMSIASALGSDDDFNVLPVLLFQFLQGIALVVQDIEAQFLRHFVAAGRGSP